MLIRNTWPMAVTVHSHCCHHCLVQLQSDGFPSTWLQGSVQGTESRLGPLLAQGCRRAKWLSFQELRTLSHAWSLLKSYLSFEKINELHYVDKGRWKRRSAVSLLKVSPSGQMKSVLGSAYSYRTYASFFKKNKNSVHRHRVCVCCVECYGFLHAIP